MQNTFVILALLGLAHADGPKAKSVAVPKNVMDEAKAKEGARKLTFEHLDKYDDKEGLAKHSDVGAKAAAMSKEEIHRTIREQARYLDIKVPTFDDIKSGMVVPAADE